jgi:NAD(P)-dependent dehydrogenase (short-subunit alcohol dehydrogenase family)
MAALDLTRRTIAVIPGTGRIGSRLAFQYAKAGLSVVVGSRDAAKAQQIAAEISKETQSSSVKGLTNAEAAASGDIIIWNPAVKRNFQFLLSDSQSRWVDESAEEEKEEAAMGSLGFNAKEPVD